MLTDDLIATFSSAQAAFTERVHAVAPDQWQRAYAAIEKFLAAHVPSPRVPTGAGR